MNTAPHKSGYDTVSGLYSFRASSITIDQYDEYVKGLKARQEQLDEQLLSLTHDDKSIILTASYLLEVARKAPILFSSSKAALKSKLLRFLVSNLQLEGKKLVYNLKAPFDTIVECFENENWRARPDDGRCCLVLGVNSCGRASNERTAVSNHELKLVQSKDPTRK